MKISAVVITKNEESNLSRLLKSVLGVVDEVLVVDSGSTDGTEKVLNSYAELIKVRFISTEWKGYGLTKNYGNQLAHYDWILSLDADEELSSELRAEIQQIKKKHNISTTTQEFVFTVNRLTRYAGHWIHYSGWNPDWHVRLFKKTAALWNNAEVHETLEFSKEVEVIKLKGRLNHYSYSSVADHLAKLTQYAKLGSKEITRKSYLTLFLKMLFNPLFRLFRVIFFKGAFLDGRYGVVIAFLTAYGVFLKYRFAIERKLVAANK